MSAYCLRAFILLRRSKFGERTIASGSRLGRREGLLRWGLSGSALVSGLSISTARPIEETADSKTSSEEEEPAALQDDENQVDEMLSDAVTKTEDITSMSSRLTQVSNITWRGLSFLRPSIPIPDMSSILSSWSWPESLTSIQAQFSALMLELGRGPGSLYSQVVNDPPDPDMHPECQWDAEVRLGDDLCLSEKAFLRERRRAMKRSFARLFGVGEDDIDERDLPIVAFAGSGGGYRAMINTIGSLSGAQKSGLLDCMTYVSGISGSCWALGVMYSGVGGFPTPAAAAEHLKKTITQSYLDTSVLDLLITNPTNKYLLSGLLRKAATPNSGLSLTDIYGTLVSARLFVPANLPELDERTLSSSYMRRFVDNASLPLPIFTAVRHEIPIQTEQPLKDVQRKEQLSIDPERKSLLKNQEEALRQQARWLWFEFTPYEVGCDEIGAWIPMWSLGRRFENGKSVDRNPELNLSILSGIYGSAFCATLQDYYKELQPILRQLPFQLYNWLDEIITDGDRDLGIMHPVLPNEIPNFVKGLTGRLRHGSPPDIADRSTLGLMDAGAELNIPYYPLLRRDVDCIIAADASADSQDLWFARAEEYAARRGLSKWPKGARWPLPVSSPESELPQPGQISKDMSADPAADDANRKLAETQETEAAAQASKQEATEERSMAGEETPRTGQKRAAEAAGIDRQSDGDATTKQLPGNATTSNDATGSPLSTCTIWIGSSKSSSESARMDELEEKDLLERDGIAIVYNPLLPNQVVPDFDPFEISTWRLQMAEEETAKLLQVAEANFIEGQEKVTKLLRAIWQRKKAAREKLEDEHRLKRRKLN